MAITDRNLKGGEKLVATYKGKQVFCDVAMTPDGLRYLLDTPGGPAEYKSPSAAGVAIRGGKATNGWAFWSLEGEEPAPKPVRADKWLGKPKRNRAAEEANVASPPTKAKVIPIRKGKALQCDECPEKRKTAQALASHKRAHARAASANGTTERVSTEASV